MTKLKTRLPIKALSVLMAILMIFSTISIMFTVSAAEAEGGGNGTWLYPDSGKGLTVYGEYLNSDGTLANNGNIFNLQSSKGNHTVHYSIYLPEGYESYADRKDGKKLAIMLVLSGGSQTLNTNLNAANGNKAYSAMAKTTGLNCLADREGIVLIYLRQSDSSLNPNHYWNFFLDTWQQRNNQYELKSIVDMVADEVDLINSTYGPNGKNIIDTGNYRRNYVVGFSAGACLASNIISAYPDEFDGAAIVAGMPYRMFCRSGSLDKTYSYGGYAVAMDGGNSHTGSGSGAGYNWKREPSSTYGSSIKSAWNGIVTDDTAPRIVVLHGDNDDTVKIKNGQQVADSFAIAMDAVTTGNGVDGLRAVYDETEQSTGYSVSYYGLNDMSGITTDGGYSKARASRLAYYVFEDIGHTWISNDNSQAHNMYPYANNSQSSTVPLGASNANYDYNEIIWEFFEGTAYEDAETPVIPEGQVEASPSYGALFSTPSGVKFADIVNATGLKTTTEPLSPNYLQEGKVTNEATASEWNFNFNISAQIAAAKAAVVDERYEAYIKSVSIYQNVWVVQPNVEVNLSYALVDNVVITQGGSNATPIDSTTALDSWTGEKAYATNQLTGKISNSEVLETLMTSGKLSLVTYSTNGNVNFNVAAPVISIEFGTRIKDADAPVEGDDLTAKTSLALFPVYAYNSAAGYNAPVTGYEVKGYDGSRESLINRTAGHLTSQSKSYAVGVYNASDDNDTIYYSFNLEDYTVVRGNSIQSITIKYVLEGNPYYTKEDVGVNVLVADNVPWTGVEGQPSDYTTVESFSLSKGEKIEGEITLSNGDAGYAALINRINNLGGFTIAFENTASNSHYYFLSYMPTITVNYSDIPDGVPSGEITGIGTRTELDYDDLVGDLYETGTETFTDVSVNLGTLDGSHYEYSNSENASSGTNTTNTSSSYYTTFASFDIYNMAEEKILEQLKAKYPGLVYGDNYDVEISSIKLVSANMTLTGRKQNDSSTGTAYGQYNTTAQSSSDLNFNDGTNVVTFTPTSTTDETHSDTFKPNMTFTSSNPYLWTRAYGTTNKTGSSWNQTTCYVYVGFPQISDVVVSYDAKVTLKPGELKEGTGTIDSLTPESGDIWYSTSNSTSTTGFSTTKDNPRTLVATYDIYNAVMAKVKAAYPGYDIIELEFTVDSATMTVYGKRSSNYSASGNAVGYFHPTAQSTKITNGSQLTTNNGTSVVSFAPGSNQFTSDDGTMNMSAMNFTEDAPYLWVRSHGTNSGSNYVIVDDPDITDLEFSYKARIVPSEGGGSEGGEGGNTPGGGNEGGGDVGGGDVTLGEPYTLTPSTGYYTGTWSYRQSTNASNWSVYTDYSIGYICGLIFNYDIKAAETAIKNEIIAQTIADIDNYNAEYFDVEITDFAFGEITVKGLLNNSTTTTTDNRKFVAVVGDTAYNAFNNVFSTAPQFTLTQNGVDYTAVLEEFPSGTGQYLTINFLVAGNTSYSLGGIPTVTLDYEYRVVVTDNTPTVPDPITSVDHNVSGDNKLTFTILADVSTTQVKVVNSVDGSLIGDSNQYTTTADGNVFTITVNAPANDTKYHIFGGSQGTYDEERYVECSVKGTDGPDVIKDAEGGKGTFTAGNSFNIGGSDEYYTEKRVVTSSTAVTNSNTLSRPTNGNLVGTNSRYYSSSSSNYFTDSRRSTGSPQANVAMDTTKNTFPVSYLGYAYMNYDVSDYFVNDGKKTDRVEVDRKTDTVNGISTTVVTYQYTETVVSGIRISSVRAQEGYVGGWAAAYDVYGETMVAGTNGNVSGLPNAYQSLGDGRVSTSMANIGNAANLNAAQLAAAKNGGYVTIWVENTGCDWSSMYYPSAWLLVEMPTVTVTYKTITYTEKEITETKPLQNTIIIGEDDDIVFSTTGGITTTGTAQSAANGYLYASSNTYVGNSYYSAQQSGTSFPLANTELQKDKNAFAVTYSGDAYVQYKLDLTSEVIELTGDNSDNPETYVIEENGKRYNVKKVTYNYTKRVPTGIVVNQISAQRGYTSNRTNLNMSIEIAAAQWTSNTAVPTASSWTSVGSISNFGNNTNTAGTCAAQTYSGDNNAVFNSVKANDGYLTLHFENTTSSYSNQGRCWILVTTPTVSVQYTTYTGTKVVETREEIAPDSYSPTYEVYAQYRFNNADGANFSKTKLLGTTEGYGAYGIITPYNVASDATLGQVNALFTAPVADGDAPTNSVIISEDESRINEYYVLKRAYIEDTGEEVAVLNPNGDGTYTLRTTLDSDNIKTNDTYRIRVIFEYECEAQTAVDESEFIKVNLHSIFENYTSNGAFDEKLGEITKTAFAKLTNSSYVLSLDDIEIPYGDMIVGGESISAIRGSNRVYNLDIDRTEVKLNSSAVTTKTGKNEFTAPDYQAKVYLDVTGDTPEYGDILVVTYNDGATEGGEIDIYLYYEGTPEYDIDVNYEFDIVDSNGNSLADDKYTYSTNGSYSVGGFILPYDALAKTEDELEFFSKVELTVGGVSQSYMVSDFEIESPVTAQGVTLDDDTFEIIAINGAKPTVTIKYKLVCTSLTVVEHFNINGVETTETTVKTFFASSSEDIFNFISSYTSYNGIEISKFDKSVSINGGDLTAADTTASGAVTVAVSTREDTIVDIYYSVETFAQAPLNVVHEFYKNGQLVGTKIENTDIILTNEPGNPLNSYTVTPLSGTVTGISGSISSAIVDASNYYANGMSSADGNVSVAGYTVTYTNDDATGVQPAIDVVVRYDITDTADVEVKHEFYINNVKVEANVTNDITTSLKLVKGVSQSITAAQGTVDYNGTIFNLSDFRKYLAPTSNISTNGLNATLDVYNVTEDTLTVRYDLIVREITVTEVFKNSTGTIGTETTVLYVADGKEYTFTSAYTSYDEIAISNFGREISDGYTLGTGIPATFTATATATTGVEITYTVGTQAEVTVNHEYYINGNPVNVSLTNEPTANLVLNKGIAQTITLAQGTVNYNGTIFNLSDFTADASTTSNGIKVENFDVTLNEFNVAEGNVTVRYDLTVYTINVTETFVKDGNTVDTATKTVYIKAGDSYTFTSDYNSGSIIADVALGDYIRTATGADVTTAGNGAATFTANSDATVAINYEVSTKAVANVEYIYIVNNSQVTESDFATLTHGDSTMNLVYGQAVSAPSSTGTYIVGNDSYTLDSDFTKTVTVNGAAVVNGNDVILNAYNVTDDITVTVTYEIIISNEAAATVNHTYYINNTELTGSAIANVTTGTIALNLVYGESQTIERSTGTVVYNGTEFDLSQFNVTATFNDSILSMNGLNVTLNKHNVGAQEITLRYDLTVYTVVVNENFFINGVEQTADAVTKTYYVAKDDALTAALVSGSKTVNGIEVSNFIASATDSDAINGAITAGNYVATVNGDGTVTVNYNVSTFANVNITSIFHINNSEVGVDTTYVTNATTTMTGFEYGVSKEITSLAGGYVIWNGTQFNVSDFTVAITDWDGDVVSANGLDVTLNKYNVDSTDIVITYNLLVNSVTLTENFIKDGNIIETQVTTKYYPYLSDYTFVSSYGSDYVPASGTNSIPLYNFIASSSDVEIVKNSAGYIEFPGNAQANANVVINYNITTKATATVTHEYYFNGDKIDPIITTSGSTSLNLDYGVSTPITLTQGTHTFAGKEFKLSDADITVTATPDIIDVDGTNVTLNTYNADETAITVRYDLSTVVVNITETVVTDNGAHTLTVGEQTIYLLDGEAFEFVSAHAPSDTVVVNGVTIPYSLFTKTVTGAEGFTVDTSSNVTITGTMEGKKADIVITYSGVTTTANVEIAQAYKYKTSANASKDIRTFNNSASGLNLSVGDRIQVVGDRDLSFQVNGAPSITVNSSYFTLSSITATGLEGYVDDEGYFVITGLSPNLSGQVYVTLTYTIDVYSDVEVIHEFYINGKLASDATINETATKVVIVSASSGSQSANFKIVQKTSGTITANGKSYNIAELIADGTLKVDDALIKTTGLTIKRSTATNHIDKFAVQSYDYTTDERTVVIRYDIVTTYEEADVTVNSHFVNNGEYVGTLFNSTITNFKLGDVINTAPVTMTVNGIEVTFTVQSVVGNGVTITEENGVYTITEISPDVTKWSIDITYVATATANVKLTHKFYVAGKELGTITDNTVIVNLANHSGKFVALNGIVGVTTDKGIVFVDAGRFTVTLEKDYEYGTFANDIFTLNASALNGSTYEIVFEYRIDGISYAIDGEVGVKQTASAINANGQYNVVTTVNSIGNFRPIDLIFVVDVSAGAGDISNEKLRNAKDEIGEYITNSFAVNNNVRVAIVTYADGYEILTGGYITDKDIALATVEAITLAEAKDGYDVTTSNLQAGLYGARTLMNADVRRAYTDVIVIKGSEPNAAYSKYNDASYNYSAKTDATADEANAAANYELDKMNASKEIVIDLTNAETNIDATMTEIFDERNYINVDGSISITINSDEFTFVEANGVTVNGNDADYTYENGVLTVELGTLKGANEIEYVLELTNKAEGDYFVSDEIKVTYTDSVDNAVETRYGVSARVNYNTNTLGATITVITYLANSDLNPVGMDGLTVKNFYEDAIIGKPVVYTVSGVTNLTAGYTYTVKAPVIAGYTLWETANATETIVIPEEGGDFVVYFPYYASGSLVDDSIVYDTTTDMVFDVLANDTRPTGESFDVIYGIGATENDAKAGNTAKVETAFGELVILSGGKVKYSPNGITVTGEFYYAVQDGDVIRVGKIYVVPATIVKVDSSDDTQLDVGDRWQIMDNDGNIVDGEPNDYVSNKNPNDADDIYGGYEDDNSNNFLFDGGDSLYANRYQDYLVGGSVDVEDRFYTTTFTFTGTGFDIISVTGRAGGYVTIKTWDSKDNLVSRASGNILTFANTDNIYQATIFTCTDLTFDTYKVEVIALRTYIPRIGMTDTQVYLDSVRTYNPFANNTNEHYNDLHDGTKTETLKDIFVDGNLALDTNGEGLFTQTGSLDINSFMDKGTNNAINIISGQSLLFKLDDASAHTAFQVEMAAIGGSATVEVYVNSKLVETVNVDTGVFAYYDFSRYIREDSTVKFNVTGGQATFSKVRYKDAVLGEPEGEKYTTGELTNGSAPDGERQSADYIVNTARLVSLSGTSRTITAFVYTTANADSVIAYAAGIYRIAPTSVTMKTSETQNTFIVTYTLPNDVSAGAVTIDFYAYDSASNTYSSNYKTAVYTLK